MYLAYRTSLTGQVSLRNIAQSQRQGLGESLLSPIFMEGLTLQVSSGRRMGVAFPIESWSCDCNNLNYQLFKTTCPSCSKSM